MSTESTNINTDAITDFINPFGYWCVPKFRTPEYIAASDTESFIAYGFVVSYLRPSDTECRITRGDTVTLRNQFLNTLETAIKSFDKLPRSVRLSADAVEPRTYLPHISDPENGGSRVDWYLDMVESTGTLCFALIRTGEANTVIWLSGEALDTADKRKESLSLIERARKLNTADKAKTA